MLNFLLLQFLHSVVDGKYLSMLSSFFFLNCMSDVTDCKQM